MIDRRYLKETEELTSSWHRCKPARGCQSLRSPRSRPVQSFSVDPRQDLTFTLRNNKIRNECVSSVSPPSVSFWTICCEPLATWSCLSAAPEGCSILVSSCWVGDRVKRSSKKKDFCLFHLEEESARDDGWHCWRRHNPGMSWLHGLVEVQYEETKNSWVLALIVTDVIHSIINCENFQFTLLKYQRSPCFYNACRNPWVSIPNKLTQLFWCHCISMGHSLNN